MKTLGKLSQIAILSIATAFVVGCGGGGNSSSNSNTDSNTSNFNTHGVGVIHNTFTKTPFTYKGTMYIMVKSPTTGRVWLDRNLGASRVCQTFNDTACYGDYYQWGRNADGHEDSISSLTFTQATNVTNVGNNLFIKGHLDWAKSGVDKYGLKRIINNWSKKDGSSICPGGFKVPSRTELSAEFATIHSNIDAFNSFLKIPASGYRYYKTGDLGLVGTKGYLWSGQAIGTTDAYFANTNGKIPHAFRGYGMPVRCIKAQ